jgi:hypothetical protein
MRAGSYASDRYTRGLRAWRARSRLVFLIAFTPFVLGGLTGLVLEKHIIAWAFGALFGIGVGAWVAMRESPPEYIAKWQTGAEGEQKTQHVLAGLDASRWSVFHDVACRRGNYDHILVGRPGVLLLDSKNLRGTVHMHGGEPYLRRPSDPEADERCAWVRSSALAGAASLKQDIERQTGRRQWVQAVVVLWSGFDEGIEESEKCVLIQGTHLRGWLEARADMLDDDATALLTAGVHGVADGARADRGVAAS